MHRCDALIVGGGVMGSAVARRLAQKSRDVVLLERFEFGHARGSSHGGSRIFRFAYADPFYARLAQGSLPLWREAEAECGAPLVELTGGVDHGPSTMVMPVADALRSVGGHVEVMGAAAAEERFAGMRFDDTVVYSRDTGRILAEQAVAAFRASAVAHGAAVFANARVVAVEPVGERAIVRDEHGREYDAAVVVIAAGAWINEIAPPNVRVPAMFVTEEHVMHFAARDRAAVWPSFIHHRSPLAAYGLETPGEGIKVGEHHGGPRLTDAESRSTGFVASCRDAIVGYAEAWLPGVDPEPVSETRCLYTNMPSEDFVLDRRGPVVLCSPCSGHGFKFAPLIGDLAARLALGEEVGDIGRFRLPA